MFSLVVSVYTTLGCRFYAASPLVTSGGVYLGTFCVLDPDPVHNFDERACALLELMTVTTMNQMELSLLKKSKEQPLWSCPFQLIS